LTYISLMSGIHKNNLDFFKRMWHIFVYSQITSHCLVNYTEKFNVNIVHSYKTCECMEKKIS
jgi:hypothetical protein